MKSGTILTLTILFVTMISTMMAAPVTAGPSAERILPDSCIEPGHFFLVRINLSGYGAFGQVTETLCDGWTYTRSSLQSSQVSQSGNNVTFTFLNETSFTYTLRAPYAVATCCEINGTLKDSGQNEYLISGDRVCCVCNGTPPVAGFTIHPEEPVVGEIITFDAASSYDPDGYIKYYEWNFSDGNIANTPSIITYHSYTSPGTYNVTLTVTDNDGLTDTTTQNVSVGCGDVNSDGIVNMDDVSFLLNRVGKHESYEADGDFNCDGEVNMGDVILLLNHVGDPWTYKLGCCG